MKIGVVYQAHMQIPTTMRLMTSPADFFAFAWAAGFRLPIFQALELYTSSLVTGRSFSGSVSVSEVVSLCGVLWSTFLFFDIQFKLV